MPSKIPMHWVTNNLLEQFKLNQGGSTIWSIEALKYSRPGRKVERRYCKAGAVHQRVSSGEGNLIKADADDSVDMLLMLMLMVNPW